MALVHCSECGKEISTAATSCPHCGYRARASDLQAFFHRLSGRRASIPFFFIALCFALPFIDVSCHGRPVCSFTGYQVAFGTPIDTSGPLGQSVPKQSEPVAELIVAFIVAMVGGVLCLRESRAAPIAAVVAIVLLLHTKSAVATEMLRQSGGFLVAEGSVGYYLSLLSLAVAAVITGLALFFVDE